MMQPWNPEAMAFVAEASIVQKLSYKYDPDAVPQGSVLERLVSDEVLISDRRRRHVARCPAPRGSPGGQSTLPKA
jgi:hypothetical protein